MEEPAHPAAREGLGHGERDRWAIGTTVLEVAEPRAMLRLGGRMNDPTFLRRFVQALRPRPYLRLVVEGELGAGDAIRVLEKPGYRLNSLPPPFRRLPA